MCSPTFSFSATEIKTYSISGRIESTKHTALIWSNSAFVGVRFMQSSIFIFPDNDDDVTKCLWFLWGIWTVFPGLYVNIVDGKVVGR